MSGMTMTPRLLRTGMNLWPPFIGAGIRVRVVSAQDWRPHVLTPSQQRDARSAKAAAGVLARQALAAAGLTRRTLTSDAAEALLLGLWAAKQEGWVAPQALG